jgi:glycyl-tRNA synthetase beta chain
MLETKPLLVEIGCEELPPKALDELSGAFARALIDELSVQYLAAPTDEVRVFASPRRLAALAPGVATGQHDVEQTQHGPPVHVGVGADGNPTPALIGFAKRVGAPIEQLQREGEGKAARFVYRAVNRGQSAVALLPGIIERALKRLPIPKPMRWGDHDYAFVRPVHWLVILHGDTAVPAEIFGVRSGRESRGHRFHHPQPVPIANPDAYVDALRAACVLADPAARRERIRDEVDRASTGIGGFARLRDELLDEIKNLTEWPVAIACGFERDFLRVPQEALIQTMETNQKFVPVFDGDGRLTERFIGVANIESKDPSEIRKGYERVIRPRFADAKFFFDEDLKRPLATHQEALKSVTYQQRLGSVWDKCVRVAELARVVANRLGVDAALATRAAALCKCDLMTRMVGEFPELQGIMGRYYAAANGENAAVAQALDEFYAPRFSGDAIAQAPLGRVLAVAERLDTLAGGFAVGLKPTGNKDPFALRRAALGLARTLIEAQLELDFEALLREAVEFVPKIQGVVSQKTLDAGLTSDEVASEIQRQQHAGLSSDEKRALTDDLATFVFDRLRGYYLDQGFAPEQFEAVRAIEVETLVDFDRRLRAVAEFSQLPDALALAAANKRIGNILRQAGGPASGEVDPAALEPGPESELSAAIAAAAESVEPLIAQNRYVEILRSLAALRAPVDRFFDHVMVMADDAAQRRNRLILLGRLRRMFLHVADISLLPAPERGGSGAAP